MQYVLVGSGFLRGDMTREPGLADLANQPWLETVYDNGEAVIYRIREASAGAPRSPGGAKPSNKSS